MRRRLQSWAIEETKDGSYALLRGNRVVVHGLRSRDTVIGYLQAHRLSGERVYEVEPDGYRTEITRTLLRSKVIQDEQRTAGRPLGAADRVRRGFVIRQASRAKHP